MINQQILDYIKQQTQQGVSLDNIRIALRSRGWENADIDQAFNNLATPLSSTPLIKPQKGVAILNKKVLWFSIILFILVSGLVMAFGSSITPTLTPIPSPVINTTENTLVPPTPSPTPTETTQVVLQTMSPKETYLKVRVEIDGVKTYADLEAITLKYGSRTQVEKIEANRAKIDALPVAFKDQLATMAKNPASKDITTIQETINGNTATLNVASTKPGFKGTVTMVLENNQWKLELESWKQQ